MATNLLKLHISPVDVAEAHLAPYADVDKYVRGIENLTFLVALSLYKQKRIATIENVSDVKRLYGLMLAAPESGSVVLPLNLKDLVSDLKVSAAELTLALYTVLSSLSSNAQTDDGLLANLDNASRAAFAAEIGKLVSNEGANVVSLDFEAGRIEFSTEMAERATARLKVFEIAPDNEIRTLIGDLVGIDFQGSTISVRSLETKGIVVCSYFPEAFDCSVMVPHGRVQVIGKYESDSDGAITSMTEVSSISGVDLSPIRVPFRGKLLSVPVELDVDSGQYYWAVEKGLGINVFSETRSMLVKEIVDVLQVNWDELAEAQDEELACDAQQIKRNLLAMFGEDVHS